jgi:hypothetical protein
MVVLAEVMGVVSMIVQVSEADAHVVIQWAGDGDGHADAEDGVGDGQRIEVAIAQKEKAGGETPHRCDGREDGVGQVGEREHGGGGDDGSGGGGEQAEESEEKDVLEEKLLHTGPDSIAPEDFDEL